MQRFCARLSYSCFKLRLMASRVAARVAVMTLRKHFLPRIAMTLRFIAPLIALLIGVAGLAFAADKAKTWSEPPKMTIDVKKTYIATFDTDKGQIVCELYPKEAPNTVNNFVFLCKEGFY